MKFKKCLFVLTLTTMATSMTGCFKMGGLFGSGSSNSSSVAVSVPTGSEGPVSGVMKADQEMPSLQAMTGVQSPSNTTTTTFNANKSNLSVYGNPATDVGQPFLQAHITIAAEFCNDAISQNAANIYPGINFSGAPSQFSGTTLTNVVNAMATHFWRRNVTSTEQTTINSAVAGFITDANAANSAAMQTTTVAIALCASMLGTTSAVAN